MLGDLLLYEDLVTETKSLQWIGHPKRRVRRARISRATNCAIVLGWPILQDNGRARYRIVHVPNRYFWDM